MTTALSTQHIIAEGLRVIADGQTPSGAYIASPTFPEYAYAWLRDGSYVALAMDAAGRPESAAAFHGWVAGVLDAQAPRIREIIGKLASGQALRGEDMLPTRYTLAGEPEPVVDDAWPNFQLDGYGTWLFALHQHTGGSLPDHLRDAVAIAADYLAASWRLPCYDYWEESGDRQHTSTLAAIAAGLRAAGRLLGRPELEGTAAEVLDFVWGWCVRDGSFVKGPDDTRVDASLLSLAVPFGLVGPANPVMIATVDRLRGELLSPTGGVYRYLGDTYYGGNPWLLLTAWFGWYLRLSGDEDGYLAARDWVVRQAADDGKLGEQILTEPQHEERIAEWVERWGPVANPLLWSHAKFILMESGTGAATWS
jgi:GH15 family glucan-1,4-alpha-glucosidase